MEKTRFPMVKSLMGNMLKTTQKPPKEAVVYTKHYTGQRNNRGKIKANYFRPNILNFILFFFLET